jgi:transcriptional regulator
MYLPEYFRESDEKEVLKLIRDYPFATLITKEGGEPYVSHLPILLNETTDGKHSLIGHLARSNPQAKHIEAGQEVLVLFNGPHTYISPRWYPGKENVPTWNYATVHVAGKVRSVSTEKLREILDRSVAEFENGTENPWKFSENPALSNDFRDGLSKAIIGFEIAMTRVEPKFKLSQNREAADFEGALQGLTTRKDDMSRAILELMMKWKKRKNVHG